MTSLMDAYSQSAQHVLFPPGGADDRRGGGLLGGVVHHTTTSASTTSSSSSALSDEDMVLLCQLHRKHPGIDAVQCQNVLQRRLGHAVKLETIQTFLACLLDPPNSTRSTSSHKLTSQQVNSSNFPFPSSVESYYHHKLVPSIDPKRFKFCGEMGLHWLEIFKHRNSTTVGAASSMPSSTMSTPASQQQLFYSLVAFMGIHSPGSPLTPPVLFDLSDETLDSRWFHRSLQAAVATRFFEKGDVLVLDPRAVLAGDGFCGPNDIEFDMSGRSSSSSPVSPPTMASSSLDEYLWNLIDPRDGQPLRLCLLWLPFATNTANGEQRNGHRYSNPIKLLFADLLPHLHKYPLQRIKRPVESPHVTAVVAKEWLSSITVSQVELWCHKCGYEGGGAGGAVDTGSSSAVGSSAVAARSEYIT